MSSSVLARTSRTRGLAVVVAGVAILFAMGHLAPPAAGAAVNWVDGTTNPVVAPSHRAYYPDLLYSAASFSGHGTAAYYKTWYDDGGNIWLAYSNDAKTWSQFGSSAVLSGARHPQVVYDASHFGDNAGDFIDGTSGPTYSVTPYYKMWYWYDASNEIRFAYSPDGESWSTNFGVDVLPHSAFPDWPGAPVYDVEVLYNGTSYQGWADNNGRFYNVSSADGIAWTVGTQALEVGAAGTWDDDSLSRCSVVHLPDGSWHMWYGGTDAGGGGNRGIGYATSADGLTWTRDPSNPLASLGGYGTFGGLGAPGTWNSNRNYAMSVVYDAAKFSGHGDLTTLKMLRSGVDAGGTYSVGYSSGDVATPVTTSIPASSTWSLLVLALLGTPLLVRGRRTRRAR